MSHPLYAPVGGMLVSLIVDCILHGILMLQMYWFFVSENWDHILLRLLVGILWAADTFQMVLLCHALYHFLVLNFNNAEVLEVSVWSLDLEVAPSVLVTFAVRMFFTIRVWHLSNKNKIIVSVIMVFSLAQLGIGIAMCILSFIKDRFSELPNYKVTLSMQIASSVVADIAITAPLVYYLNKSRTGINQTNSLINKLILWSVNTALLTGLVELLELITWVTMTDSLLFIPFHLVIAKRPVNFLLIFCHLTKPSPVYTNCMLAMHVVASALYSLYFSTRLIYRLNGRSDLRRTFKGRMNTNSLLASVGSPFLEDAPPQRPAKSNGISLFQPDTTSSVNTEVHVNERRMYLAPESPSANIPPSALSGTSMEQPWDVIPRVSGDMRASEERYAIPLQNLEGGS